MDSSELTPQQAAAVCDRLVALPRLLNSWKERMRQLDFPGGDPLLLATGNALEAASELTMRFHKISDTTQIHLPNKRSKRARRDQ